MITRAALLLLQALDTATAVTVRDGERATRVPIVFARAGRMVRADALGEALGTALTRPAPDRFVLTVATTAIEFTIGIPFARVGSDVTPLGTAPAAAQGALYLPLMVVTDLIPRVAAGFQFDPARLELRRFRATVTASERAPPVRVSSGDSTRGSPPPPKNVARPRALHPPEKVVVVDAGHGGRDRGMSGPIRGGAFRMYEADVTLQVARRVRDALQERGVRVIMTRDRDTLIALGDRGRIANKANASLFLSIHVNAANLRWRDPGGARGFETYFLAEAKTEDERRVEQIENEATKYEAENSTGTNDDLSFILNDMKQNEHLRESSELAATMQRTLAAVHPGPNRGVKQAGFVVLVSAYMPAVLVEIGFGSNIGDARYISSVAGQRELARTIADATTAYLTQLERRSTSEDSR
ncbi:MAG: N-acetylmuramoyl-L-alanine amidase [Gemmatimonadaceae bacterium]